MHSILRVIMNISMNVIVVILNHNFKVTSIALHRVTNDTSDKQMANIFSFYTFFIEVTGAYNNTRVYLTPWQIVFLCSYLNSFQLQSFDHKFFGLLSIQLHIIKKGNQCLISSTYSALTNIQSNISIRFSFIFTIEILWFLHTK